MQRNSAISILRPEQPAVLIKQPSIQFHTRPVAQKSQRKGKPLVDQGSVLGRFLRRVQQGSENRKILRDS